MKALEQSKVELENERKLLEEEARKLDTTEQQY
jgi:hypothetical protein